MKGREAFAGLWQVDRRIEDALAGSEGRFEGQAELTPQGDDGLIYREAGVLTLHGTAPMQAERVYHWRFDRDDVAVAFEDGRAFHRFSLRDGAEADHLCGADLYRVRYGFENWPEWSARWRVRGPRKDYVMVSRYQLLTNEG